MNRGKPDLGPLPHPARFDVVLQLVAILWTFCEQAQQDDFLVVYLTILIRAVCQLEKNARAGGNQKAAHKCSSGSRMGGERLSVDDLGGEFFQGGGVDLGDLFGLIPLQDESLIPEAV